MNTISLNPLTRSGNFTPANQGVLQRKCACGNQAAGGGTCESCAKKKTLQRQLRVGASNDPLEHEADRVANQVMTSQAAPAISSFNFNQIQREEKTEPPKEKTDEEKYKEGAKKLGEAFLKTPVGKQILDNVKDVALGNWTGRIITGSAAIGTITALAATEKELPMQLPEIPLDFITPGFSVELAYNGPVNKPTDAMLTFKFTEQAPASSSTSKPLTASEKYRAETARIAADQAKFRAGMIVPGSPEDLQQKAEQDAIKNVTQKYSGGFDIEATKKKYPWLATPEPKTGLQLNKPTLGYQPASIFCDQFKLTLSEEKKKADDKNIQKKLSVGASNDPLEHEADRVANQVMANEPTHSFSNMSAPKIQRRAEQSSSEAGDVPASVEQVLTGSGSALPQDIRTDMEQRFDQDFSQVRIHTDNNAAQSTRDVQANAYTVGNNIVFGSGQFSPESQQGKHLLAHELTHVVQQQGSAPTTIRRWSWGGALGGAIAGGLGGLLLGGPIGGLIGLLGGGLLGGLLGDLFAKKPPECKQGVKEVKVDFVRMHEATLNTSSLLDTANEIFSDCCIKFVAGQQPVESEETTKTWLGGNTDLDVTGDGCTTLTPEQRAMHLGANKAHSLSGNIQVFLVKSFSGSKNAGMQGYSCPQDPASAFPKTLVMQNGASGSIFAHELGHILTYGFDYSKESKTDSNYKELRSKMDTIHSHIDNNLMFEAPSPDSPTLTPEQCAAAFANAGK